MGGVISLGVDADRLIYAARHAAVTRFQLARTSIHFYDQHKLLNNYLGYLEDTPGTKRSRRSFRQYIHSERAGIHEDQFKDRYPIAIGIPDPDKLKENITIGLATNANQGAVEFWRVQDLNEGDLVGVTVLAHEVRHVAQSKLLYRPAYYFHRGPYSNAEGDANNYVTRCVEMESNNPWLGIVQVGQ